MKKKTLGMKWIGIVLLIAILLPLVAVTAAAKAPWIPLPATGFIGVQKSTAVVDGKRNLRFVSGLTLPGAMSVSAVGIEITVFYGEGDDFQVREGYTTKVYDSIIANGTVVTAASEGFDYLYTARLEGIPVSLGTVTLRVRTYYVMSGDVVYSNYVDMPLDLT